MKKQPIKQGELAITSHVFHSGLLDIHFKSLSQRQAFFLDSLFLE